MIVAGVCGRDLGGAELVGGALEKGVADATGLGFEVAGRDRRRFAHAGDVVSAGERLDERAIAGARGAAEPMIEVRRDDADVEDGTQLEQGDQKRDRVAAARDGREHSCRRRRSAPALRVLTKRLEERPRHGALKITPGACAQVGGPSDARRKLRVPVARATLPPPCGSRALVRAIGLGLLAVDPRARGDRDAGAPASLDDIPSADPEDVTRLLRKVRHRHGRTPSSSRATSS